MYWILALVIVLFIGVIAYRKYYYPSLSATAKQQRSKYIGNFQKSKTLIYQMRSEKVEKFNSALVAHYQDAHGCYYGNGVMIYIEREGLQMSIQVFSGNEDDLARNIWKITRLKEGLGGEFIGTSNG